MTLSTPIGGVNVGMTNQEISYMTSPSLSGDQYNLPQNFL